MTMTKGEKAELTIEPEWGYGKKGNIDAGYPLIKAACTETLIAKCFQYYNKKSYKTEQVWYLTPFITKLIFSRGVARGGGSWGAGSPNLDSASDWLCLMGNLLQPIRSSTHIWVVMHIIISIKILGSFLRLHFTGKLLMVSQNGMSASFLRVK